MLTLYIIQVKGATLEVYAYSAADALAHYDLTMQEIDWIKAEDK